MSDNKGNFNSLPSGKVAIVYSDGRVMEDNIDGLVIIPIEHHNIHEGKYFIMTDYDLDVDNATPKYWRIKTPDTAVRIHFSSSISVDTAGLVEFYENPTINAGGTELTVYNSKRDSSNTTTTKIYKDTTTSNDGTLLEVVYLGTNNNRTKIGGITREAAEIVLNQNEDYIIKYTPDSDGATVAVVFEFYEV